MNIAAVIPAYNESRHIQEVVRKVKKHVSLVIVVDDSSADNTAAIEAESGADVVQHLVNLGKGAALKTGCDYALRKGAEAIVVLDADAQHNPEQIPGFLKSLEGHDIVFGYRRENRRTMPLLFRLGNWFIEHATNLLFGISVKDTQCGYRAFTADAYRKIRWRSSDYSVESEMIALTGKHGLRFSQLPIETIYTDKYKGTTVFDGIKIVRNMLWWRMTR